MAFVWSLRWSGWNPRHPQPLHMAGFCFPGTDTCLPSATCSPADAPGQAPLLRLDRLGGSVGRGLLLTSYQQHGTVSLGVTLHSGTDREGSRGMSCGDSYAWMRGAQDPL